VRRHGVNARGEPVSRRLHPCPRCGRVLTTRTKLNQHIKVVHEGQKDHPCRLPGCDRTFASASKRKEHEVTRHLGEPLAEDAAAVAVTAAVKTPPAGVLSSGMSFLILEGTEGIGEGVPDLLQ